MEYDPGEPDEGPDELELVYEELKAAQEEIKRLSKELEEARDVIRQFRDFLDEAEGIGGHFQVVYQFMKHADAFRRNLDKHHPRRPVIK